MRRLSVAFLSFCMLGMSSYEVMAADPLVVYSSRKEHLIKPLFDLYTKNTGTKIEYITDKAGPLMARLAAEGDRTKADLFITVDAGNLWKAADKGLFQAVDSEALKSTVPAHLRDPDGYWHGLSLRARTIVYSKDRVDPKNLSTYEALGDEQWKGRLCLRTSKKVYNQSLIASMMSDLGVEATESVVKSWVANLATDVFPNDTSLIKAVIAGQCDVGIVNTYYFGRLQKKESDIPAALFWPNQEDRGVHVNVSGAGVTKHSDQPAEAIKLLEWLASPEAQGQFAGLNQEYPVNPAVDPYPLVKAWGEFKPDTDNIKVLGAKQADAIKLMDRAGYR